MKQNANPRQSTLVAAEAGSEMPSEIENTGVLEIQVESTAGLSEVPELIYSIYDGR